jgi:hypothetical protein
MLNALMFLDQIKRQTTRQAQNPLMPIQNLNTSGFSNYFGGQQQNGQPTTGLFGQPQTSPQGSPLAPQQGIAQPQANPVTVSPNATQSIFANRQPVATSDMGLKDWAAINQPGVSPWARPGG